MSSFDAATYWANRKSPNAERADCVTGAHIEYIWASITPGASVIDVGPGNGRTLVALGRAVRVTTIDCTDRYAGELQARANYLGIAIEQRHYNHGESLPARDVEADFAIVCEVLLHQPHDGIERFMQELARVSTTVLAINSIVRAEKRGAEHCFARDYRAIAEDRGMWFQHDGYFSSYEMFRFGGTRCVP